MLRQGSGVIIFLTGSPARPHTPATSGIGAAFGAVENLTRHMAIELSPAGVIEAGASRQGAWITGKPPSDEVMDLVQRYGITPEEPAETEDQDEAEVPGPIGPGVMASIARHLEAAFRDKDLSLLGTLLHPQVHWTGLCTSSDQVLDWYRALAAAGTEADVRSVEVDRDAVVLGLGVGGRAEGARPAPRHQLYTSLDVRAA
jgi:hypothetical protein